MNCRSMSCLVLLVGAVACGRPAERGSEEVILSTDPLAPVDSRCALPAIPTILFEEEGAVLQTWTFPWQEIFDQPVLPPDPELLAFRGAIIADGADLKRPIADRPVSRTEAEAEIWRDEDFNNDLVFREQVGEIRPITCLDALLFAHQANRVPELDQPTEFVASVLRKDTPEGPALVVVFGAGTEMFPPKAVYGFDIAESYVEDGWTYWYALHNHTVQKSGERLAPGTPVPSTSDVHLMRNLARNIGLQSVRVTNGFFTFDATVSELDGFRSR